MLDQIVRAGDRGIDHGNLRPWRVVLLDDRDRLADAFEAAARELTDAADQSAITNARQRALDGPVVLALVARLFPGHPEVHEHEQWMAVGAATQQMLLAAEALGFAGSMLSGRKTRSSALRTTLNLAEQDSLVGFLTFGTADPSPDFDHPPSGRPALTRLP